MVEPLHLVAVPTTACMSPLTQVIHWAHTSLLSCHPGVKRTMFVISRRFWWPAMEPEVREYIEACSVGRNVVLTLAEGDAERSRKECSAPPISAGLLGKRQHLK